MKINALEKAIGKGNGTVRKALDEETPNPKLDTLIKIAEVLDTTVSYLIGETDEPQRGQLVLQNEKHRWDNLLPLNDDECAWIEATRLVKRRANKELNDYETEKLVNEYLDWQ